jgi:hypothetical protein
VLYFGGNKIQPETALLISPEEVEACLPIIRRKRSPEVHLLLYAAPVTRRTLHFNNLDYCAVPALPRNFKAPTWLKVELGIIAGRLYFEYEEYEAIKTFMGVTDDDENTLGHGSESDEVDLPTSASEGSEVLVPGKRVKTNRDVLFTSRPVTFMNEYLTALRKECDITATPMAYVLSGKPLTANHSFFVARNVESVQKKLVTMQQELAEQKQEEDLGHGDDLELLMADQRIQSEAEDSDDSDEGWYETKVDLGEETRRKAGDVW